MERYDWGMPLFEAGWDTFMRSSSRASVGLSMGRCVRVRMLLAGRAPGRHGDVAKLVAPDLKALCRIPSLQTHVCAMRARLAFLHGDRASAIELVQLAIQHAPTCLMADVDVHRHALGLLRADAEGERLCIDSERALCDAGVVDPLAYVRSFYPELFTRS